jgi:protein-S-isoprenylcysteine O-methyltransferase Ste14
VSGLKTAIFLGWAVFWIYWLVAAVGVKTGRSSRRRLRAAGLLIVAALVLARVVRGDSLAVHHSSLVVHDTSLEVLGAILFAAGLGLAVWARIYLGRNWGMPRTQKDEPELVTAGPYRFVRHPIYTGILFALLGTALAVNLYWLIAVAAACGYFIYSARAEEKTLTDAFPTAYPRYRARTKMLIPFVL